jgi:hypothetical protein
MNKFHGHEECGLPWFAIVLLIVLAVIYATFESVVATATMAPEGPGLVGVGCTGASGPIYAFEESDLPECVSITRR